MRVQTLDCWTSVLASQVKDEQRARAQLTWAGFREPGGAANPRASINSGEKGSAATANDSPNPVN
jgi:hypothetical protein